MSNSSKTFIKHARQRLDELGIGVNELSLRLGVAQSNVSMYLNGKRNPKWETVLKYAEALSCDPQWLLGQASNEEPPRLREPDKFEIAYRLISDYLPAGDRKDAALLLLSCDDETLQGVLGGLRPFLKKARKAENLSSG
jgi:transcriptional regulator with XRE-family HTH domain